VAGIGFGQFRAIDGDQIVLLDGVGLLLEHRPGPIPVIPGRITQVHTHGFDRLGQLVGTVREQSGSVGELHRPGEDDPGGQLGQDPQRSAFDQHAQGLQIITQ